jgi:membrane fusion protein, multidrug efflux system
MPLVIINIKKMNKIFLLSLAVFAISCSGKKVPENPDVLILKNKKDSLQAVYQNIGKQISELESDIARLDTNANGKASFVSVQTVQLQKFEHFFTVHGSVESSKNVMINAEVPGMANKVLVEAGQAVEAGETMVVLDTDILRKNVEEVKSAYDLAENVFQRQEKLWNQKIGSELQYLEAKNKKESLGLKLKTLQVQLEKSEIKAPFRGIVDEVVIKQGEMAQPMFPLLRLVNLDNVYIVSDVSEEYIGKIKQGTTANIFFPSINYTQTATVTRVGKYINPNNRTFKIQIDISNKEQLLIPNLLAEIKLKDYEQDSSLIVPSRVVQNDASGKEYLFVVEQVNGVPRAKKVIVKSGHTYENKTVVLSGINPKDEIIVEGARSLKDGEEIMF